MVCIIANLFSVWVCKQKSKVIIHKRMGLRSLWHDSSKRWECCKKYTTTRLKRIRFICINIVRQELSESYACGVSRLRGRWSRKFSLRSEKPATLVVGGSQALRIFCWLWCDCDKTDDGRTMHAISFYAFICESTEHCSYTQAVFLVENRFINA